MPATTSPPKPWTLVVLAAGIGHRFGGDKQLVAVEPGGATLSDYAIADARLAGATGAVFVTRPELADTFREHHRRWKGFPIRYALQQLDDVPAGRRAPQSRTRPWGTTHAVLAAGPHLTGGCLVLNADDYYGADAVAAAGQFLAKTDPDTPIAALVGYRVRDTLSPHGGVSRALIEHRGPTVTGIHELGNVAEVDGQLTGTRQGVVVSLTGDELVSMNCWAFTPALMPHLRDAFVRFLDQAPGDTEECALPDVVGALAAIHPVQLLQVGTTWLGMTWPGDIPHLRSALAAVPSPFTNSSAVS
ncbi:MAG: NTP transferase domain-containing protein [Gemmatimonadota bacterium]